MASISRLRMANMFPLNNSRMNDEDENPFSARELIGGRTTLRPPMKFGGIIPTVSSGGGYISPPSAMDKSRAGSQALYESYKDPINAPLKPGLSNDEASMDRYFDRQNKERTVDAAVANAGNKGWKVGNVIGPDGTPTSVRYNEQTGATEPLGINGPLVNKETPGAIQKRADAKAAAASANKAYLDKTSDSLTLIKDLMDDKDNLTPEGARATGASSIGNFIPFTQGYTGSTKINKLKSEQVLNLIGQLKAQSRTGATGMGNMSNKDLSVIEKAATLLDTNLPEEEFQKQLRIVKHELGDIQDRLTRGDEISNTISPMASHDTNSGGGRIRVRNKQTGQTGTISEGAFNPQKYDRVQ